LKSYIHLFIGHLESKSKLLYDWQSVSISWYRLPVGMLLSDICGLISVGRPLWREDGSTICNVLFNGPSRAEPVTILCCLIWDSPNLESQVQVFISPRNRVAQWYPRALGC
jgi:hypothetical protein